MNRQKWMVLAAFSCLLSVAAIVGCGVVNDGILFPGGGLSIPLTPAFLVAVESTDGVTTNVNVFPINASTGALGTAVVGSPFNMGMTDGMTIAVHPNGHWLYAADPDTGMIHQWDVNTTTGKPTDIAPAVANQSGTYYQPHGTADSPTHVLAITPNGKFLLASNDNAMVSSYSIGANGALTHVGDVNVGATRTSAITATDDFAWVNDNNSTADSNCVSDAQVIAMSVGANGALTKVKATAVTNVQCWLWSIAISPDGKFVQVGGEDSDVYSFSVGADGSLTAVGAGGPVFVNGSDIRDIGYSPDGKFFYSTDDTDAVNAFKQNADGTFSEIAGSPFDPNNGSSGDQQIAVDLSGKFVYTGGESDAISTFTRDANTGVLTFVGPTATANNDSPVAIGIVRKAP